MRPGGDVDSIQAADSRAPLVKILNLKPSSTYSLNTHPQPSTLTLSLILNLNPNLNLNLILILSSQHETFNPNHLRAPQLTLKTEELYTHKVCKVSKKEELIKPQVFPRGPQPLL